MLKFGLRSLFAAITVVAVACAWLGSYIHRHHWELATVSQISAQHSITYTAREPVPFFG